MSGNTGFKDMVWLAECDFEVCTMMESRFPDEFAVRAALYHLHQAVEKELKAIIIMNGQTPPFKHDIDKLAEQCRSLGEEFSPQLELIADSLTLWESKTRYDPSISFSKTKYDLAKQFYEEAHDKIYRFINSLEQKEDDVDSDTLDLTKKNHYGR